MIRSGNIGVDMDGKKVIRVFPRRTSYTPRGDLIYIGDPQLFLPEADAVHVSVTFTWDISEGYRLCEAWDKYYEDVRIGGPAIDAQPPGDFEPGFYVKDGITFTSRGCPYKCIWCLVPDREGELRLLDVKPGNVIQDNNFLATPREHQADVFEMLRGQDQQIEFRGGVDKRLVDDWFVEQIKSIRLKRLYMAADTRGSLGSLEDAVNKLGHLTREQLSCYVLIGYGGEKIWDAERRLRAVWEIGCMPFAQLYQPPDKLIKYSDDWKKLARIYSRPMLTRREMG